MKKSDNAIPAWMVAQALIIKAKNALVEEAVNTLYKEIEAKRMSIKGTFKKMSEDDGEMQQGMFLIRQLMNEKDQIIGSFSKYIEAHKAEAKNNATEASRIHDINKFLGAVDEITSFATASMVFDGWFNEVSVHINENDPAEILANTAQSALHRKEALGFLVSTNIFKSNDVFTKEEKGVISRAAELTQK